MQGQKKTFTNHSLEGKQDKKAPHLSNYKTKIEKILEKFYTQNQSFQKWAKQQKWATFHHSHYDWWAFPINQNSSYGEEYKVNPAQIEILKKDKNFIKTLKRNAQLVCLSWGYKLNKNQFIPKESRGQHQKWQNWPIRLYKLTKSLQIFQHQQHFENAVKYGCFLISKNLPMQYGKRNIKQYFLSLEKISKSQKICKVI